MPPVVLLTGAGASDDTYSNHPARNAGHEPGVVSAAAYALNRQARPRPEVVIDSQPPRNRGRTGQGEHAGGASSKAAPQVRQSEAPPQDNQGSFAANRNQDRGKPLEPTHPYAATPDATNGSVPGPVTGVDPITIRRSLSTELVTAAL